MGAINSPYLRSRGDQLGEEGWINNGKRVGSWICSSVLGVSCRVCLVVWRGRRPQMAVVGRGAGRGAGQRRGEEWSTRGSFLLGVCGLIGGFFGWV